MMIRMSLLVLLCMTGFAVAESCEPEILAEKQFLTLRFYEKGEREKVLVECALQVPQNGVVNTFSGGEVPVDQGKAASKGGMQVTGKIKPAGEDRFHVALKLQIENLVESQDTETHVVRTQTIEIRSYLVSGFTKRIHCGGNSG